MTEEKFDENLMRLIAAQISFTNALMAAREMFGRGYFSLGAAEKQAVDNAVIGAVAGNYQAITPALLAQQESRQPVGFGVPSAAPKQEKS